MMLLLELSVMAILAVYYGFRILGNPERKRLLINSILIAAAAWLAEETCILFYRFYSYNPGWSLFIADVPAPIVLIWPAVILSASDIGERLARGKPKRIPLIAAGIVWTDASLIEPIAVHAGLWHWNRPGVMEVPLIGIFGWGYFAFFCVLAFGIQFRKNGSPAFAALRVLIPLFGSHAALVCTWWTAFKWIDLPVDRASAVFAAWSISLLLSYALFRTRAGRLIEKKILLHRLPASLFIFVLLAWGEKDGSLSAYTAAFILPYLTVLAQPHAAENRNRQFA